MANTLNVGNGNWAVKKDSLLGYNSENGNYKPLPFDFTRASSATVVNKAGLIETVGNDIPRIDFKDDANGALLLEPQRTNLWTESEAPSIILNSPLGEFGFYILNNNNISRAITYIGTITFTFIVKKIDGTIPTVTTSSGDGDLSVLVSGGSTAGVYGVLTDIGNGFYKYELTAEASGASVARIRNHSGLDTYVSLIQYEQGSYATSYIPTSGSPVTRLADVCNNAGNEQMINSTEGTLYAEISALADDGTNRMISLSNGVSTTSNATLYFTTTTNQIRFVYEVSSVLQCSIISTIDVLQDNKFAIVYKLNRFELWGNGVKLGEDTSGSVNPSGTFTKLSFLRGASQLPFYGKAKALAVYNTALTDSELQQLTTI